MFCLFRYAQIVVSKLGNDKTPTDHPGDDLRPYDSSTVNNKPYIAAEVDNTYFEEDTTFTVGDSKQYSRSGTRKRRSINFNNVELKPETFYSVFQRTFKSAVSSKRFFHIRLKYSRRFTSQ